MRRMIKEIDHNFIVVGNHYYDLREGRWYAMTKKADMPPYPPCPNPDDDGETGDIYPPEEDYG